MEYFWLRIRTGAPQGYDGLGGIHVEKAAQVVVMRRENRIATWFRNLKSKFKKDNTLPGDRPMPNGLMRNMLPINLVVEVPATVKWILPGPRVDGLWLETADNIHNAEEAPEI